MKQEYDVCLNFGDTLVFNANVGTIPAGTYIVSSICIDSAENEYSVEYSIQHADSNAHYYLPERLYKSSSETITKIKDKAKTYEVIYWDMFTNERNSCLIYVPANKKISNSTKYFEKRIAPSYHFETDGTNHQHCIANEISVSEANRLGGKHA